MKRLLSIFLTVTMVFALAACGSTPEATQPQNGSFQIGNLHFLVDSDMTAEDLGENSYIITLNEKRAFITMYARDLSSLDADMAELFVGIQHNKFTEDRDTILYEIDYSTDIAGFPANGEVCSTITDSGIVWGHMDLSFTDTWYSYTFMFKYIVGYEKDINSDTEYSTGKEYGEIYGNFLNTVNYMGPAPRENGPEATQVSQPKEYPGDTGVIITAVKKSLPDIIFTTSGEENGLIDTMYYIEGEVTEIGEYMEYPYFIVRTESGDAWISEIAVKTTEDYAKDYGLRINLEKVKNYYPFPAVGEQVCVYAQYTGMSRKTNHASFAYGGLDYMTEVISLCSENPLTAAQPEVHPVRNGSNTATIGKYALVRVSKEDLKSISETEYNEFCVEVLDSNLYNWVSIVCDDGTGIQFTGSQYIFATYGRIDREGIIQKEIGSINLTEDGFEYEPAA